MRRDQRGFGASVAPSRTSRIAATVTGELTMFIPR
jgi:hypothetical protein